MIGYKLNSNGNSKSKRVRHGCEKYWNKYGEPFVKLLSGKFPTSDGWLKRKYDPIVELREDKE